MSRVSIVSGVANRPEPDGSFILEVTTPEGQTLEAVIQAENVPRFLRAMQESLIQGLALGEGNIDLPMLEVTDINLGHRERTTELMISTQQISTLDASVDAAHLDQIVGEGGRAAEPAMRVRRDRIH